MIAPRIGAPSEAPADHVHGAPSMKLFNTNGINYNVPQRRDMHESLELLFVLFVKNLQKTRFATQILHLACIGVASCIAARRLRPEETLGSRWSDTRRRAVA